MIAVTLETAVTPKLSGGRSMKVDSFFDKAYIPAKWLMIVISAAVSATISATLFLADNQSKIEAHEASIHRLESSQGDIHIDLRKIDERLSRIEGQLSIIIGNSHGR